MPCEYSPKLIGYHVSASSCDFFLMCGHLEFADCCVMMVYQMLVVPVVRLSSVNSQSVCSLHGVLQFINYDQLMSLMS